MKSMLLLIFTFSGLQFAAGQSQINLNIHHKLDDTAFAFGKGTSNDLNNAYLLQRLEYYLSGFAITHDGGQVTEIENLYALIDLSTGEAKTTIDLGTYDIQTLEGVSFHLGVDEAANHSDPSLYHPTHPLAPKFPSMHWGWAAGYRFIALEGKAGESAQHELQFHCIGDEFYKEIALPVFLGDEATFEVDVNAEYGNLLAGINIQGGLILHGNLGAVKTLAGNMVNKVFTSFSTTSTEENAIQNAVSVFPNPSASGLVELDGVTASQRIVVSDALGRTVSVRNFDHEHTVQLPKTGVYFISILDENGRIVDIKKVAVL